MTPEQVVASPMASPDSISDTPSNSSFAVQGEVETASDFHWERLLLFVVWAIFLCLLIAFIVAVTIQHSQHREGTQRREGAPVTSQTTTSRPVFAKLYSTLAGVCLVIALSLSIGLHAGCRFIYTDFAGDAAGQLNDLEAFGLWKVLRFDHDGPGSACFRYSSVLDAPIEDTSLAAARVFAVMASLLGTGTVLFYFCFGQYCCIARGQKYTPMVLVLLTLIQALVLIAFHNRACDDDDDEGSCEIAEASLTAITATLYWMISAAYLWAYNNSVAIVINTTSTAVHDNAGNPTSSAANKTESSQQDPENVQ